MPAPLEQPAVAAPESAPSVNGVANEVPEGLNGTRTPAATAAATTPRPHTPRTPSLSGLSLTEYSANPSPPSEEKSRRASETVPEEFLLPNGHPDVRVFGPLRLPLFAVAQSLTERRC
jgi:hypothetical protein